jgi:hypothetical protein
MNSMMDLEFELLLKVLGLGGVALLITHLEWADRIFQATRNLPQPWADIGAVVTLVLVLRGCRKSES